ncbi:anti-phage protein KwaA [Flavobacterium sp.]|uniref:anti-phage protein KwaA n=1 Tax=Flavobacterium sp. TaxID=239 RepID=UPI00260028AF|nr:anti-phage protein KwaA [Flavobacterium sp.]
MKRKIGLYFLSLWLLFFLTFIITIQIPFCFEKEWEYIGTSNLFKNNIVAFLSIIFIIIGTISFFDFLYKVKGTSELPFKIISIEKRDYEHLTFLTTYIVPLICFNFNSLRYLIVFYILLFIMGVIYIRTDLFYANPSLAILQFRIYKVSGCFVRNDIRNNVILITLDKLDNSDEIKYIKLDDRIYYAKKVNNE